MKKKSILLVTTILLTGCSFQITGASSSSSAQSESASTSSSLSEGLSTSSEISEETSSESIVSSSEVLQEKELLDDVDFVSLDRWQLHAESGNSISAVTHGDSKLVIDVNNAGASNYWDVQVLQNSLLLEKDDTYYISFKIKSSVDRTIKFIIQTMDYSLTPVDETIVLTKDQTYSFEKTVTIQTSSTYLYGFMFGNINGVISETHQIEISDVSLYGNSREISSSVGLKGTYDDAPLTYKDRDLAWHDEFNGTEVDLSKWTFEIGTGDWGWGNNERQYYLESKNNAEVSDGSLKITARKETYNTSMYTSARMKTKDKYEFHYGYVEARLAAPSMPGIWPAYWMLGANIDERAWPYCGEIDLMEAINYNDTVYSTLHWNNGSYGTAYSHAEHGNGGVEIEDRTQYHIYGFEWTNEFIATYVDDVKVFQMSIVGDNGLECFREDFFFLLNVAVGGNWPGFSIGDSFPQTMSVDYIRVYQ